MFSRIAKLFTSDRALQERVTEINTLEPEIQGMSNDDLRRESVVLRERATTGTSLDELLPRAFALVREAAQRTLGQRHYDVQLMGAIALHQGKVVEMRTGEGKTLAATAPIFLNALSGRGVHVVTVNEYLAKRDTVWMGQVYHALGMSVSCLVHEGAFVYDPDFVGEKSKDQISNFKSSSNLEISNAKHEHKESALLDKERDTTGAFRVQGAYLRPISRREAYGCDITYGTNHEFGFDYLRDNLAHRLDQQVQTRGSTQKPIARQSGADERGNDQRASALRYAIIDEVDSILIDEARTPLIISAPDQESSKLYTTFARVVTYLQRDTHYLTDEKMRSVDLTQEGIDKVEELIKVKDLYSPENLRLAHYLQESLRAKELFLKDRDYVNKDGEIIIVDQSTGRLMPGRRYSGGLHQALEAKEGISVRQESRTYASVSIQNYFRLYEKFAGMTGTAQTSAEEFDKVYGLEVVTVPTHQPMIREDHEDLVYKTREAKYRAIAEDVKRRQEKDQPVLIGTISIEKNEELSRYLGRAGVRHEILNAKQHEREGEIIAQAGRRGAVTVATNLAGRGVDIILGGNPPSPGDAQKVRETGGLHVIGTERH
ncbi:preprotein translocase subunit SecA, partial [Candidatus Uhrbacteria bacterium]|nr:preprotein translocase subunit SecA [Candidatus Uhrbacteria bacterium]